MSFSSEPTTRRALITGARGFTGAYVRDELQRAGYEVTGTLAGSETAGPNEYVLDITSLEACRRVIGEVRPTHIVHLAAISFVAHDDALAMYGVNVLGTLNLLQACIDVGIRPDKILIASSANVYGNAGGVIDESVAPAPVNHYAASKLAMEHLVRTWFDRLPVVVTRPFNYTGRGQDARFLVPKIVTHFVERRPYIELGNLDVARDFSDVRTVAATYRALLESAVAGEVVNVCSEHARTLHEVVDMVSAASGHDLEIRVNPAFVRDNEMKMLVGSAARLHRLVPEVQPIDFADTIRWMVGSVDQG
ncbi:NAD-dependent epimerase/dehydratase family protein [Paraburkholderia sp.]|uniref:NAD-dependent epimerase/dehydratase family protein n=1 Tax=Paraburkholderia sp. TaxID=1926495 RepID=UPI003D6F7DA5